MANYWVKMSTGYDSNPKVLAAGWLGSQLFLLLVRLHAVHSEGGFLPSALLNPVFLRTVWHFPGSEEELETAIQKCVEAGLLHRVDTGCQIAGWTESEWGRATSTERVRRHRERKRQQEGGETLPGYSNVSMLRNAKKERKKDRERTRVANLPSFAEPAPTQPGAAKLARDASIASTLCEFFNKTCGDFGVTRRATPNPAMVKRVAALVKAGASLRDMKLVVCWAVEGDGWAGNERMERYLQLETLLKRQSSHGNRTFFDYLDRAEQWLAEDRALEQPETAAAPRLLTEGS